MAMLPLIVLLLFVGSLGPDDEALAKLRAYERSRRALITKLAPAVCAVMSLKRPGGGSGVIFSPNGWLLTNYHVTGKNKVMKIGLPDGRMYLADVIGIDPGGDIAVCALRGKGNQPDGTWPFVQLGHSDKLRIGGLTYAMGNPFLLASDFKPTVTIGIVSGIHRYQAGTGPNKRVLSYPDCVQVDAPINPGNSGGPLFDENGLLVGINGRITIRDRGRVNTGVGFAVSIAQIKNFLPGLLAGRHTEHGTLDGNVWKAPDPNTGRGEVVHLQSCLADSILAKAGLKLGDLVTHFNGLRLDWANQLAREVGILPAGYEVTLGYRRYEEQTRSYLPEKTVRLKLARIDTGSKSDAAPNVPDWRERPDFAKLRAAAKKKAATKKKAGAKKSGEPGKKSKRPEKRDLDREEHLFRYMDGLMASFRHKLAKSLSGVAPGKRTVSAKRTSTDGKTSSVVWSVDGAEFVWKDADVERSLSKAEAGSDVRSTLKRELDLNPLLSPSGLPDLLKDAYLEGGVFIGSRVGYVCALRGPGKRAVFLDRDGYFPIGYRFRSFLDEGIREVRFVDFERIDGRMFVKRAEVRINDTPRAVLEFVPADGRVGFVSTEVRNLRMPDAEVEKRITPLMKSVVKVHGASGLKGVPSYGTGLIVSAEGHVLTWKHVSLLKERCRIVFEDGGVHDYVRHREYPKLGITILRPVHELPKNAPIRPLELPSDRKTYAPGTAVLSIGNAFKLAEFTEPLSVTFGVVVSTVRSDLRLNLRHFPFKGDILIVDAPSNPGTHGGGLFTLDGKLIGLLTPLVESRETNSQLSLAVPSHELAAAVAQATGRKREAIDIAAARDEDRRRVYTGIKLFDTGRRRSPPAYIDRVMPRSPAARAQLRSDDLVVRIDEFPIRTCEDLSRVLSEFSPGDTVDVTFKRGSSVSKVKMKLEAVR